MRRGEMKHRVYCYECRKFVDLEMAGDLGQYRGEGVNCPCGEETLFIKDISLYGLFSVHDLRLPSDIVTRLDDASN